MSGEQPPRDHVPGGYDEGDLDETSERRRLEDNVKRSSTWLRLLFMLVFVGLYAVSRIVVGAVVILQFLWVLFSGETNARLLELGQSLAVYTSEIIRYLTYNTERRPFPFDEDWPSGQTPD